MEIVIEKERHRQQVEVLKHQNVVTEERINYLKDTERRLKQIVLEWRKSDKKEEVVKQIENLLFKKKEHAVNNKLAKKAESKYSETNAAIVVGAKVKMKKEPSGGRGKRDTWQEGGGANRPAAHER